MKRRRSAERASWTWNTALPYPWSTEVGSYVEDVPAFNNVDMQKKKEWTLINKQFISSSYLNKRKYALDDRSRMDLN